MRSARLRVAAKGTGARSSRVLWFGIRWPSGTISSLLCYCPQIACLGVWYSSVLWDLLLTAIAFAFVCRLRVQWFGGHRVGDVKSPRLICRLLSLLLLIIASWLGFAASTTCCGGHQAIPRT